MATKSKKPTAKKPAAKKLAAKKLAAKKPAPKPAPSNVLDLTGEPKRLLVKLPQGDFELKTPEELTFEEFSRLLRVGKELTDRASSVGDDGVLDELQSLVVGAAQMILVDLSDEAAKALTPGRYLKIQDFFNSQAKLGEAENI